MGLTKNQIAKRIAQELQSGYYVNLGIGIPTLVANYVPEGIEIAFQSENGILGMGPFPMPGEEDPDLINAGKQTITPQLGASYFDSSISFGMIRGKHIDLTVLGAMDLVASSDNIIVAMMHTNPKGESKLRTECTLPLTGVRCVKRIVTDLAVLDVTKEGFLIKERAKGVDIEEIKRFTQGKLIIPDEIPEIQV